MKYFLLPLIVLYVACLTSCSKPALESPKPIGTDSIPVVDTSTVSPIVDSFPFHVGNLNIYQNVVFSSLKAGDANQYFSTRDTSFHSPLPKIALTEAQITNVDLLYIYDDEYSAHGFMSPYTAGHEWYWNNSYYYYPWLSASHETIYRYAPDLNTTEMSNLIADPSLFDGLYQDMYTPWSASGIFPAGTCIGGRGETKFAKGQIYGLLFDKGKRGFLVIRLDQEYGWPDFPITGFRTKVDIIVER